MAKKKSADRPDAIAAIEFSNACMKVGDWQHRTLAEIVSISVDLGVPCGSPYAPKRRGGKDALLVFWAFHYAASCTDPDTPLETAFVAGEAMQQLRDRHKQVLARRSGKRDTHVFYLIADDYLSRGNPPGTAYLRAKQWCAKAGKRVPSENAFAKRRSSKRNGSVA